MADQNGFVAYNAPAPADTTEQAQGDFPDLAALLQPADVAAAAGTEQDQMAALLAAIQGMAGADGDASAQAEQLAAMLKEATGTTDASSDAGAWALAASLLAAAGVPVGDASAAQDPAMQAYMAQLVGVTPPPTAPLANNKGRRQGVVNTFDSGRGFGFITCPEIDVDVFVHQSAIMKDGYRTLQVGETVEFDLERDSSGPGRWKALNVTGVAGKELMDVPHVPGSPSTGGTADRGSQYGPVRRNSLCKRWMRGSCHFGSKCDFIHDNSAVVRLKAEQNPYDPANLAAAGMLPMMPMMDPNMVGMWPGMLPMLPGMPGLPAIPPVDTATGLTGIPPLDPATAAMLSTMYGTLPMTGAGIPASASMPGVNPSPVEQLPPIKE